VVTIKDQPVAGGVSLRGGAPVAMSTAISGFHIALHIQILNTPSLYLLVTPEIHTCSASVVMDVWDQMIQIGD
jgi:hypothetical protein